MRYKVIQAVVREMIVVSIAVITTLMWPYWLHGEGSSGGLVNAISASIVFMLILCPLVCFVAWIIIDLMRDIFSKNDKATLTDLPANSEETVSR